jgi:hypothetical protein
VYTRPDLKYPLFLSDFNKNLIFLTDFLEVAQISNFPKIHLVVAEFPADGWRDGHDEADSR